ncbi:MAG TPA: exonuclease SbcCD subunit D [Kineosporiaceae bacterium]|nr:exonuclease SbcCD subunit D [Kineosporiaceae bacterium]
MRLLHTSDWHLGRSFHRVNLLAEQAGALDHLVDVVRSEAVDVVVVAGDVYDRALPGVDVVTLLDDALARLAATGATIVLTSGNHDSPRRLGFAARLLEHSRVHVRTDPARCGDPVLLEDASGSVAVYPLPYLEPALVAPALGLPPGAGHEAVLGAAMDAVRADLAARPAGTRSVVAAHAFVVGGLASDSERDISVGGIGGVPATVFDGVDYVALGHLHGRQRLGEAVRYSGSPLAYSFSEHGQVKGSWLVELGRRGPARVDPVDAPVPRRLAVLRGALDELLADPGLAHAEAAWCQVTLTDDERPAEAMTRLRSRFPHTLELRFEPAGGARVGGYTARTAARSDLELCCGFVEHVRNRAPDEQERAVLRDAVEGARVALARESGVAPLRAGRRLTGTGGDPQETADEARAAG